MRIFDSSIDLSLLKLTDEIRVALEKRDSNDLFEEVLIQALRGVYQNQGGVPAIIANTWYRLQLKLNSKNPILQLAEDEIDLIKNALLTDKYPFDFPQYRLVMQYVLKFQQFLLKQFISNGADAEPAAVSQ